MFFFRLNDPSSCVNYGVVRLKEYRVFYDLTNEALGAHARMVEFGRHTGLKILRI